eukprot:TRINITY_DN4361_c0_g1_i20.p1 TRINITY_DN4361_c0_g1~~TRINITY_DN4361_c0_g1_i20.p1  ORF type:complete len:262 (+),score=66.14 TRINITY_DN4361_c0_g1_i20:73-858(+)
MCIRDSYNMECNFTSTISISDLPNVVKVARQSAVLGLYANAITNYNKVFIFLNAHLAAIQDSSLKKQWKRMNDELMKEMQKVDEMKRMARSLMKPSESSVMEESQGCFFTPKAGNRFETAHKAEQRPRYSYSRDNLPNDYEEVPGVKVYFKDYRTKEAPKQDVEAGKDPDVWDPPFPRIEPHKPKNFPNWSKPRLNNHKQKIKGGGAGTGCMSGMGGVVNYRQAIQGEIARNYDKPWANSKGAKAGAKSPEGNRKSVAGKE